MTNAVISPLIPTQFPLYVQENYPAFVQFIQDYYAYMEQNYNSATTALQSLLSNIDIDTANGNYLQYFQNTYPDSIPQLISVDRRLLSKAMVEINKTKGSLVSYQLLFRVLFNVDMEISYPKEQMLRVSDGKWVQNTSIFVNVTAGNIADTIGRIASTINSTGPVTANISNYTLVSGTLYQLFFENMSTNSSFLISDTISVQGTTFTGVLQSTTSKYKILSGGSGFKVGQILPIITANGSGSTIKVTATGAGGSITQVQPVAFGSGYLTNFNAVVYPYSVSSGSPSTYGDYTSGFVEGGVITNGSGQILGTFTDNWVVPPGNIYQDSNAATIAVTLSAVANYPGYYSNTDGFVSDVNVIQDGTLYQDFSYVIQSSMPVSSYRTAVQKLLHPAGTKMFGEYQITIDADLSVSLTLEEDILNVVAQDVVSFTDSIVLETARLLTDTIISSDSGVIYLLNYVDMTYVDETYVGETSVFLI